MTARASMTQRTYERLRTDIVAGRIRPGQRLRPSALATEHSVSLNVVREALSRLAGAHLVRASPQLGFSVAATSPEDLADLTEVRIMIESSALRRSIEHGDLAWESEVVAAHHRLERTPMTTGRLPEVVTDEWMRAHIEFHDATMAGCASPRLVNLVTDLQECASLYRQWSHRHGDGVRDVAGEHRGILDATVARDAALACRRHIAHIRRTCELATAAMNADARGHDPTGAVMTG